ncbi:MAG: ABC transporter ATP-binding protein [Thermoanaerobaculia bacterium]|nr:ABC transporter ATP-binding protein [Thermoanaerobaculia bacterium]
MGERPEAEPAVVLDAVRVVYRVPLDRGLSLKEAFVKRRRRRFTEHVALDGVDLAVRRGEALGIVGANGAGKTTLLKVVARVLHPASGRVRVSGRVAPLLDLVGTFHPELTGRENAMLAGAFLGLSRRESGARVPVIEAFAGIGTFMDAPLRTYSSGMILRLAFAAATSVDADVLAIDEALAVGDAAFQEKCAARMREFRERGVTFVVVSHDVLPLAAMCDRVAWLEDGRLRELGPSREVVAHYLEALRP